MDKLNLLTIGYQDEERTTFSIKVASGVTMREVIFAMAATCKCFVRDGLIPTNKDALDLFAKYLTEEQYDEPGEQNDVEQQN